MKQIILPTINYSIGIQRNADYLYIPKSQRLKHVLQVDKKLFLCEALLHNPRRVLWLLISTT